MLRTLKIKFIGITMSLLGLVLFLVLGSAYVSSIRTFDGMTERALAETIDQPSYVPLVIANTNGDSLPHISCYVVEGTYAGDSIKFDTNLSVLGFSTRRIANGVRWALDSDEDSGTAWNGNIRWVRRLDGSHFRIAFVSMQGIHEMLRSQLLNSLAIFVIAMLLLFLFTYFLSRWAFAPVERSWEQQVRFIADASHELKTPLSVIKADLQILDQSPSGFSNSDRVWIARANEEVRRMQGLVTELLELAEAENVARSFETRTDLVDFTSVVEKSSLQLDPVAFERAISIETHSDNDVYVRGNVNELERLVTILIENACKYANPRSSIDVCLQEIGSSAVLDVNNMGDPIKAEDLPHLFERFYRTDHARTREGQGGYGLGLAIAKTITEAHGGTISARSDREHGTTFTLTLPVVVESH